MSKMTTCLWFDGRAEEAARFYASTIPESRVGRVMRSPADNPSTPEGAVLTVDFTLAGQSVLGLNGGPQFRFTEAISFILHCEDQAEIDRLWDALSDGGEPGPCGWLKDRFGLSWQIVPRALVDLLSDPDRARAGRAMEAMMRMGKLDIDGLRAAADAS